VWKIYKEGQGKLGRGLLAFVIAIGGVFAVVSLHDAMPVKERLTLPIINWSFDYRFLIEAPILVGVLIVGVWLFNRPATADFLIDTESELKNKVTWPSRREEINASTVVVVTVIVLGIFILAVDSVFNVVQGLVFPPLKGPP
jgi:preprotein translocase SecE subunit